MLKNLRFPLLYLIEAALAAPQLAGFIGMVSFIAAKPTASLDLHGKALPASWEAAVFNHGRYLRGYLIGNHPEMFAATVLLSLGSALALYRVALAQAAQFSAVAAPSAIRAHKIARNCVFGAWALLGYVLVVHVMVGIDPA